jgi:putative tryptophan/tyrosine transport system substrate-binding protein
MILDPSAVSSRRLPVIESAALALGIQLMASNVHDAAEIEPAVDSYAKEESNGGLIVLSSPLFVANREKIITLAAKYRLPAVYQLPYYARSGGLLAYGPDPAEQYRGAAAYVDRILRGANPGDLPVQQPTKYAFVINLKTAKALGLTIPETLLATADEVIQ